MPHLEPGLHDGPLSAGLTLPPWSAGLTRPPWSPRLAAGSWAAGTHLVTRYGTRVMHTGPAVLAVGPAARVLAYRGADPRNVSGPATSVIPAAPTVTAAAVMATRRSTR
ncbi:hypothetical protein ACFVU0_21905 [Streptomyces sp. NPDC058122]|uniref:hypothetical protein n=1 Tax=Streptomyces sp. NPDC058122 TaxID=3346349 RepID=UPI0036E02DD3